MYDALSMDIKQKTLCLKVCLTPRGNKVAKVYNTHFVSSFFMIDFYRDELRCSNPPNPSLF